jgi:hypothetical protein
MATGSRRNGSSKKEQSSPVFSRRFWTGSGNLEVAVWERTVGEGDQARSVLNTTMKKTYKDGDDFKESNSLRVEELGIAILAIQSAFQFISDEQGK